MNEDPLFSKLKGTLSPEHQAVLEAGRGIREQQHKAIPMLKWLNLLTFSKSAMKHFSSMMLRLLKEFQKKLSEILQT